MATGALQMISHIAEQMERFESDGQTPLSPYFRAFVEHLIQRADAEDHTEFNLRTNCYDALTSMIANSSVAEHEYMHTMLAEAVRRLEVSLRAVPNTEDERRNFESQQIAAATLIHSIAVELDEAMRPTAEYIINLLMALLDSSNATATEEALNGLAAVANSVGDAFVPVLPTIIPKLLHRMTVLNEADVLKAAVFCLGTIVSNAGPSIQPFLTAIMDKLIEALRMPDYPRRAKVQAVTVFGDLATGMGTLISSFLEPILYILDRAASSELEVRACPLTHTRARACVCV